MDALRILSFGEACGEVVDNVFGFFFTGLVGGVAAGAACLVDTTLVLFGSIEAAIVVPSEVLPFLLLDSLGLARTSFQGVGCGGAGVDASAACPSAVMATMMSNSCWTSVGVRVTLVAAASSSASTCSASSSEAGGVSIFSLPFLERTGMKGSSSGLLSSSSWIMCLFLVLEDVLTGGSSRAFSKSFYTSVGEMSVTDLSPSSSG